MFPHIIENSKLIRNLQNTWKYHKTRLAETDTKLIVLLSKLHGQNKGRLSPSYTWITHKLHVLRFPLNARKHLQVQLWQKVWLLSNARDEEEFSPAARRNPECISCKATKTPVWRKGSLRFFVMLYYFPYL